VTKFNVIFQIPESPLIRNFELMTQNVKTFFFPIIKKFKVTGCGGASLQVPLSQPSCPALPPPTPRIESAGPDIARPLVKKQNKKKPTGETFKTT
jgi:hypothetical protein